MQNRWLRLSLIVVGSIIALCVLLGIGLYVVRLNNPTVERPGGIVRRVFMLDKGHSAIGRIQSIDNLTITLQLRDETTQIVFVDNQTRIERDRKRISVSELKTGDRVAVFGSPTGEGQIAAKWVHVIVSPPSGTRRPTPAVTPTPQN
jgi:hypothetical protein